MVSISGRVHTEQHHSRAAARRADRQTERPPAIQRSTTASPDQHQTQTAQGQAQSQYAWIDQSPASESSKTERSGLLTRHRGPIAGGIGGAVVGFLMGGPIGGIVGAATGAGLGFLLPTVFDKVIGLLKDGIQNVKQRFGGESIHDHDGDSPETVYTPKNYVNINQLEGGQSLDGQTHYPPTKSGNGDGKRAYFFIGFKNSNHDQNMRRRVEPYLADDIQRLRENGYDVTVDTSGTRAAFQKAVDDDNNAGIYWAGHGMPQGIQDSQSGQIFRPEDIQANPNNKMRFCIFKTCLAGQREQAWEARLGTDVLAHKRVIYDSEIRDFNDANDQQQNELDDIISDRLINQPWP